MILLSTFARSLSIPDKLKRSSSLISATDLDHLKESTDSDSYLSRLTVTKLAGKGTHCIAFLANLTQEKEETSEDNNEGEVQVVVRVNSDDVLDYIPPHPTDLDMIVDDGDHSSLFSSMRAINYLKNREVPLIQTVLDARQVMFYSNVSNKNELLNVMVLEYGSYGNLDDYIAMLKRKFSEALSPTVTKAKIRGAGLDIIRNLIFAVSEASKNKIIHGDIKPANIFVKKSPLDNKALPFLGDWDLAYDIRSTDNSKQIRYTPMYRPPEMSYFYYQNNNNNSERLLSSPDHYVYTGQEDIFALGVSLINSLSKLKMFDNNENVDIKRFLEGMVAPFTFDETLDGLKTTNVGSESKPEFVVGYFDVVNKIFDRLIITPSRQWIYFLSDNEIRDMLDLLVKSVTKSKDSYNYKQLIKLNAKIINMDHNSNVLRAIAVLKYIGQERIRAILAAHNYGWIGVHYFMKFLNNAVNVNPMKVLTKGRFQPENIVTEFYRRLMAVTENNLAERIKQDLEALKQIDAESFKKPLSDNILNIQNARTELDSFYQIVDQRECMSLKNKQKVHDCQRIDLSRLSFECLCSQYITNNFHILI